MAFRVFVSYSTKDQKMVERVRTVLADANAVVFIADHSIKPGESLTNRISEAVRSCDIFLLLWSRHSKASEWVQHEVGQAL